MTSLAPRLLVLTVLAATIALFGLAAPAAAVSPCGKRVAEDWRDNGRIDGVYELHCYEEGLDAIPPEIRDYTNAEDVIRRAYLAAGGTRPLSIGPKKSGGSGPPTVAAPSVDTSASSSVPVPVLALGAMALVLVAAGAVGYVSRRRRDG